MKLRDIHHYDTYVPILSELDTRHTWKQAVDVVVESLEPLGNEYCRVLDDGLAGRWCDRYPEPGQAQRRVQLRLVRRLAVHPDELPARRARPRLHAGPRSGPLDAQLLLGQASAVRVLQLHDLRRRSGQHVQRATAEPAPDGAGQERRSSGPTSSTARSTPSAARSSARRCSPSSRRSRTRWSKPASRSPSNASRTNTASCWPTTSAPTSSSTTS